MEVFAELVTSLPALGFVHVGEPDPTGVEHFKPVELSTVPAGAQTCPSFAATEPFFVEDLVPLEVDFPLGAVAFGVVVFGAVTFGATSAFGLVAT